jgi:hypothetical protein
MGEIIPLGGDRHFDMKSLLPWYVNGSLDREESAEVEAHLAECAECRAELALERSLNVQMTNLPLDVEQGWATLRQRLEQRASKPSALTQLKASFDFLRRPVAVGWALAAPAACFAFVVGAASIFVTHTDNGPYHTLGSPRPAARGSLVVVFKPTTSEQELREILRRSGARLVDGPTAADAYVLQIRAGGLTEALSQLRADSHVVLAEPIDRDGQP